MVQVKLQISGDKLNYSPFKDGDVLSCEISNEALRTVKYAETPNDIWYFIIGINCALYEEDSMQQSPLKRTSRIKTIRKIMAFFL